MGGRESTEKGKGVVTVLQIAALMLSFLFVEQA